MFTLAFDHLAQATPGKVTLEFGSNTLQVVPLAINGRAAAAGDWRLLHLHPTVINGVAGERGRFGWRQAIPLRLAGRDGALAALAVAPVQTLGLSGHETPRGAVLLLGQTHGSMGGKAPAKAAIRLQLAIPLTVRGALTVRGRLSLRRIGGVAPEVVGQRGFLRLKLAAANPASNVLEFDPKQRPAPPNVARVTFSISALS